MAADCNSPNKHKSSSPPSSPIPWAQVVRGADSEARPSTPRASNQLEHNVLANNENKSDAGEAATPVIGGEVSWPSLSECTRTNSSKTATFSQGPIIPQSSQKSSSNNTPQSHSNSSSKHTMPGRQHSMKQRSGGSSAGAPPQGGGFSRPPPPPPLPPPFPIFELPYGNLIPPVVIEPRPTGGVLHLPHVTNHSRREGSNVNWRHNQDRREGHLPYQFVPRHGGFIPPPPPRSPPFMSPPVRPLGGPIGFDVTAAPAPFMYVPALQGMPPPPPAPLLYPVDPNLPTLVLKQIDYYFSDANLVQDHFLRSKMDAEGWVPLNLIANFPRVRQLTNNILFIMDCLKTSKVVEVQGEKIRRRNDWKKWIHSNQSTIESVSHASSTSIDNALETTFERVSLDESAINSDSVTNTINMHIDGEFNSESESLGLSCQSEVVDGQCGVEKVSTTS